MPFVKGQSGNPEGRRSEHYGKGCPQLLAAMRYVVRSVATPKEGGMKAHCRKLLADDPKAFMKQLAQLEQAYLRSKRMTAKEATAKDRNTAAPVLSAPAPTPAQAAAKDHDDELKGLITSLLEGFGK
jgi:hypothetical protein